MTKITLQNASKEQTVPKNAKITGWAELVLEEHIPDAEINIRIVDETEMANLNQEYRNKNGPTNVLAFPSDFPSSIDHPLLGDVIICAPVISNEAKEHNTSIESHWAHIVIHGVLHLLGFDHDSDTDANTMENVEITLLESLGFENPYHDRIDQNKRGESTQR